MSDTDDEVKKATLDFWARKDARERERVMAEAELESAEAGFLDKPSVQYNVPVVASPEPADRPVRDNLGRILPGSRSLNPRGRIVAKDPRQRLARDLLNDFAEDWAENGRDALRMMRVTNPAAYVQVASKLLPREIKITDETGSKLIDVTNLAVVADLRDKLAELVAMGRRGLPVDLSGVLPERSEGDADGTTPDDDSGREGRGSSVAAGSDPD